MRWKLLLIASLLAAISSTGAILLAGLPLSLGKAALNAVMVGALVAPLVSITLASIFVYRHTARRRKLQALATALLASLLTLTAVTAGVLLLARWRLPQQTPIPTQPP